MPRSGAGALSPQAPNPITANPPRAKHMVFRIAVIPLSPSILCRGRYAATGLRENPVICCYGLVTLD